MEIIHEQLKEILSIINESDIEYWASGGTLLGAIRHKDIIPWDDDIDLEVLDTIENHEKILYLRPYLNSLGYELSEIYFGYKIFPLSGSIIRKNLWREHQRVFKENNPHIRHRNEVAIKASPTYIKPPRGQGIQYHDYKYPYLDIFLVNNYKNKISCIDNRFDNFYHHTNDLFPLKKIRFGNLLIYTPYNPLPYLNRGFGKDYMTKGKKYYDHKNEKIIPLQVFII